MASIFEAVGGPVDGDFFGFEDDIEPTPEVIHQIGPKTAGWYARDADVYRFVGYSQLCEICGGWKLIKGDEL